MSSAPDASQHAELETAFRAAFDSFVLDRLALSPVERPDEIYQAYRRGERIPRHRAVLDAFSRVAQDGIVIGGAMRRLTHDEKDYLRERIFESER